MSENGQERSAFATLLKQHRDALRWSQEKASWESEIDHSLWSRLEADQRRPTRLSIRKMGAGLMLTDAQIDRLLIAAGYLPDDQAATIADESGVLALYRFLRDDSVPATARATVREIVDRALRLATATA